MVIYSKQYTQGTMHYIFILMRLKSLQ